MNINTNTNIKIGSNRDKSKQLTDKNSVSQEKPLYVRAGATDGTNETKPEIQKLSKANRVKEFVSGLASDAKNKLEKIVSDTASKAHANDLRELIEEIEDQTVPPTWVPDAGGYPELRDRAEMIVSLVRGKDYAKKGTADVVHLVEHLLAAAEYYGRWNESQLANHPQFAVAFELWSAIANRNSSEDLYAVLNSKGYGEAKELRKLCFDTPFLSLFQQAERTNLINHIVSLEQKI
jgi:hypothetical protein